MFFVNGDIIRELFDGFEIIKLKEIEKDGTTKMGEDKHWHIFVIFAQKVDKRGK